MFFANNFPTGFDKKLIGIGSMFFGWKNDTGKVDWSMYV